MTVRPVPAAMDADTCPIAACHESVPRAVAAVPSAADTASSVTRILPSPIDATEAFGFSRVTLPEERIVVVNPAALIAARSDEITELAKTNRELLGAGFRAARDTLLSLGDQEPSTYTPSGQSVAKSRGPLLVNQAI